MLNPEDAALLLQAFNPLEDWAENKTMYRQWRLLRGESSGSKKASASAESEAEAKALPAVDGEAFSSVGRVGLTTSSFTISQVIGEGNYSQV